MFNRSPVKHLAPAGHFLAAALGVAAGLMIMLPPGAWAQQVSGQVIPGGPPPGMPAGTKTTTINAKLGAAPAEAAKSSIKGGKTPRKLVDMTFKQAPGTRPINLAAHKGKVRLIMIFSTECDTCIASVEILSNIQKKYGPQGVQIVAAAVNRNAPETVRNFIDRYQPAFPVGLLDEAETRKLAALEPDDRPFVPIFLFVNKAGTVVNQYQGDHEFFKNEDQATRGLIENLIRQ